MCVLDRDLDVYNLLVPVSECGAVHCVQDQSGCMDGSRTTAAAVTETNGRLELQQSFC